MKKMNLLDVSVNTLDSKEMSDVVGSGVACHPSNCDSDISSSVNNAIKNMRTYNPPIVVAPGTSPIIK